MAERFERPFGSGAEALRLLAALAGVRLAADGVHGERQGLVRFLRDRAEGHGAGGEALHDLLRGLDLARASTGARPASSAFLMRNRPRMVLSSLSCSFTSARELAVALLRIEAHRMLQRRDRVRVPGMHLAAQAIGVFAADIERVAVDRRVAEGVAVTAHVLLRHLVHADAFDGGRRAEEVAGDELGLEADRIEDLRAAIGLVGRDAHLGHHLEQALADGLDVALDASSASTSSGSSLARASLRWSRRRDTGLIASAP